MLRIYQLAQDLIPQIVAVMLDDTSQSIGDLP
jgi:hypothetical protein